MLQLKLLLVPLIIVSASLVGTWFGPRATGRISSLPILAGPVLWLVASSQGAEYGARAAAVTLSGVSACAAYGVAYFFASRRWSWRSALALGLAAWFVLGAPSAFLSASVFQRAALTAIVLFVARLLLSSATHAVTRSAAKSPLFGRALSGGILAIVIDILAKKTAPQWTGLVTAFPILSIVLTVSTHRAHGPAHVRELIHAMVIGFPSFASFCFVLAACLQTLGIALTFVFASGVALALSIILDRYSRPAAAPQSATKLGQEAPNGDRNAT